MYVVKKDPSRDPPWKGTGPAAEQLDIELTERCNNACIHCCINRPAGDRRCRSRELDTAAWKEILRQAAAAGVMTVRFTGGEPLLRSDFSELYLFARRLGLKVLLFTNARLITPGIAGLLADVPPLETVEVSVYGMTERSYEAVTASAGSHREFRTGVQRLVEAKIPFVVKGTLLPPNKEESSDFAAWAETLPWMDTPPSYSLFLDLRGRRDSVAKNRRIRELRLVPEEGAHFLARQAGDRFRREMIALLTGSDLRTSARLFTCGIGPGCVDAYGSYQPCLPLRHPGLTFNLKKGTIREAMATLFPRLREMRATNPDFLARCASCFLRGMCEQCPAKSWAEHGTLDTPVEYFCQVAQAQARFLGLLDSRERAWEVRDGQQRIRDLKREDTAS
jgi:radical SAM protein with 4Fe4S-binding SPASM domain